MKYSSFKNPTVLRAQEKKPLQQDIRRGRGRNKVKNRLWQGFHPFSDHKNARRKIAVEPPII